MVTVCTINDFSFRAQQLQLPAPVCTGGQTCLSRLHRAAAQIVYVVLTLFRLSQISSFTLLRQSQMLPFCPNCLAQMWSLSPASAPQPQPFQLFVDLHNPFWWSGLLLVFSWHATASVDVFLTYPWSKRHSTSTCLPSWLLLQN